MKWKIATILAIPSIVVLLVFFYFSWSAPAKFPIDSIYTVEKGVGLSTLSNDLSDKEIIRHAFWFKTFSVLFGGTKGIIAGDYVLSKKQNVIALARRINNGDFDLTPVRITVPEGLNIFEMSKLFTGKLSKFQADDFIKIAQPDEGYLFPDTYFFLPNVSADQVIREMKNNFKTKTADLTDDISDSRKSQSDIIKMASILEEEARTIESRKIVSGILWKRLDLGMPLQVDVSFKYINGKVTKDLTLADLKIDSPYNTYLYKGLPPTPISNPGLSAIEAAIFPTKTDYLYFLSDKNGVMHYAKTYTEHLHNRQLYLE